MLANSGQWSGATWTGANATCSEGVSAVRRRESNDRALRGPAGGGLPPVHALHDASFQEFSEQSEDAAVADLVVHKGEQLVLWNVIE